MEFFTHKTKIDFMSQRKWAFILSLIMVLFSFTTLMVKGLNLGLDFTGGVQLELHYEVPPDFVKIRKSLDQVGLDAVVQAYGSSKDVMVKLRLDESLDQGQLTAKVLKALPGAKLQRSEMVGSQVGKTLVTNGILAVIIALLGTMIYIALRFEYRFALSAAISLIHDPVMILGIFSFFQLKFDLIALAAVLTVIGYSLNDTIVVYDRVRENFRKMRKSSSYDIFNLSVNQTLSRTIMTSCLTLTVVTALLVFGGQMLKGFSLAMIVGIVVGTYSSIYIACSLALLLGLNRKHLMPHDKKVVDDMP